MGFSGITVPWGLRYHETDADTIAHWKFDGDLADAANGYDFTTGSYDPMPFNPATGLNCFLQGSTDTLVTEAALQLTGAMSFAVLLYLRTTPAVTNLPIVSHAPTGGGSGTSGNFLYQLEVTQTSRALRYVHQSGSKVNQAFATSLIVPMETWCWVAFTRDSAGTGISVSLNGDTQSTTVGAATSDGSAGQFRCGTKWDGSNMDACFSSMIVKDIEVSDLESWRGQTRLR